MTNTCFKYFLHSDEETEVIQFLENLNYYSVLQNPKWCKAIYTNKNCCYYINKAGTGIVAFALITESFFVARLMFGPVGVDTKVISQAIIHIHDYYLRKRFAKLEVQLGVPVGQLSEAIEYSVYKKVRFRQVINTENWTSIEVSLTKQTDDLFDSFSNNHKRSIVKSEKLGLRTVLLAEMADIRQFSQMYDEMYKKRGIVKPFNDSFEVFRKIFNYFQDGLTGFFIGVYDAGNNFCGGACFTINPKTIMYQYGCTQARFKHPVLHLAFFEAMKIAKEKNIHTMDLCGVNLLVDEADQVYNINRFKLGFNGEVIYYPRKMVFRLNGWKSWCYDTIRYLYAKFRVK